MNSSKSNNLKIIVLGSNGSGKTALSERYVNGNFAHVNHTVGTDQYSKQIVMDDVAYTICIWDTAGQERFHAISNNFYRHADCCILVYDITNAKSFEKMKEWRDDFQEHTMLTDDELNNFPFIVIGNKADIGNRKLFNDSVQRWCKIMNDIPFFECSAKTNQNVDLAFQTGVRLVLKKTNSAIVPYNTSFTKTPKLDRTLYTIKAEHVHFVEHHHQHTHIHKKSCC